MILQVWGHIRRGKAHLRLTLRATMRAKRSEYSKQRCHRHLPTLCIRPWVWDSVLLLVYIYIYIYICLLLSVVLIAVFYYIVYVF